VQNFFTDNEDEKDKAERKIELEFWNDEDNTYKSAYFYRPNTKFQIKSISGDDIKYGSIQIDLVEY
jgi:hypothetical protein